MADRHTLTLPEHVPARRPLEPHHAHSTFALEVRGLWAGYPNMDPAVQDVSLQVPTGEIVGLIGPNGAGKSTLFKSILGLVHPLQGEVLAFGQPIASARRDVAYMPQSEEVDWSFPVSALDVVLMGRYMGVRPFRRWSREDVDLAEAAMERVGMAGLGKRQVGQFSGGQRRRVLMARAIARGARLLLLDEPFAGLDAAVQHDLLAVLDSLADEGHSVLMATHDLTCVANSADEAICLNQRVIAAGAPSQVLTQEVLTATFNRHLLAFPGGLSGGTIHIATEHETGDPTLDPGHAPAESS